MKSRHLRRTVPTSRSQYAFAFGARTGVRNTRSPKEVWSSSSSSDEKIESGHESRTGADAHPEGLPERAAVAGRPSDEWSRCNGECGGCQPPPLGRQTAPGIGP